MEDKNQNPEYITASSTAEVTFGGCFLMLVNYSCIMLGAYWLMAPFELLGLFGVLIIVSTLLNLVLVVDRLWKKIQFAFLDDRIVYKLDYGQYAELFSDLHLYVDPFGVKHHLCGKKGLSLLLSSVPDFLLVLMFDKLSPQTGARLMTRSTKERSSHHVLAAFAFACLSSPRVLDKLVARHLLRIISVDVPCPPLDGITTDANSMQKTWVVEEFGENFEVYCYEQERRLIYQILYTLILPGAWLYWIFFSATPEAGRYCLGPAFLWSYLGVVVCLSKMRYLIKCKLLVKAMQLWRARV